MMDEDMIIEAPFANYSTSCGTPGAISLVLVQRISSSAWVWALLLQLQLQLKEPA